MTSNRAERNRLAASALFVLPALLFVIANLLRFQLGVATPYNALEPLLNPGGRVAGLVLNLVVIVGPLTAFALTMSSLVAFSFERRGELLIASVRLRWRPALFAVALVSALVLGALGAYLVLENLPCVLGIRATC